MAQHSSVYFIYFETNMPDVERNHLWTGENQHKGGLLNKSLCRWQA